MLRLCLIFVLLFPVSGFAAPEVIRGPARVIDGDTLDVGTTRVRLFGIDAVEKRQTCQHPVNGVWPCGRDVTREVAVWLNDRIVECNRRDTDRYGRAVAICHLGDADIGEVLVEAGLAFAYRKYSDRYTAHQARALKSGRGLWTSVVLRPQDFRQGARATSQPIVPAQVGCRIKGNISSKGQKIYHLPGQKYYDKARISPQKGERWFCSEAEARAAGWRKSRI